MDHQCANSLLKMSINKIDLSIATTGAVASCYFQRNNLILCCLNRKMRPRSAGKARRFPPRRGRRTQGNGI